MIDRIEMHGANTKRREWVFKKLDEGARFYPHDPETLEAKRLFNSSYCTLYYDRILYQIQHGNKERIFRLVGAKCSSFSARARKYGCVDCMDYNKLLEMYMNSDGKCTYCHVDVGIVNLVPDHYIPLSRGGPNTIENIRLSCESCNTRKKNSMKLDRWK